MSRADDQLYLDTLFDGATDAVARPHDMVTAHEQRSCADLNRMIDEGELELHPPWQRELVWTDEGKARFLDSLARGMPIPSVMVCHDKDTGNRYVIDGLQRLSTIRMYFSEDDWAVPSEPDIDCALRGRTLRELRSVKEVNRAIVNHTLPITSITYRSSEPTHTEHLFSIFFRVNSGSVRLNTQEIRNAIYQGRFNDMLRSCDEDFAWRVVTRRPEAGGDRFAYREIILRAFALVDRAQSFSGTLNTFLNRYMADMKNTPAEECRMRQMVFTETATMLVRAGVVDSHFHAIIADAAVKLETLFYGLIRHHDYLSRLERDDLKVLLDQWAAGDCLQPKALSSKIYGKETLLKRLAWTDAVLGASFTASKEPEQMTFA